MLLPINQSLKDIRGNTLKQSFPRDEEEKKKDETVSNVILNALSSYPIRDRKEVFFVNAIAQKVLEAKEGKIELNAYETKFLKEVLFEATYRQTKNDEVRGVYMPIVIAQILDLMEVDIKNE